MQTIHSFPSLSYFLCFKKITNALMILNSNAPDLAELDQLLEDAPLPFIMQHATKLSNVRKRVSSLNLLLRSVQHRLDNIDRMMSIGSLGM